MSNQLTTNEKNYLTDNFRILDNVSTEELVPLEKLVDASFVEQYLIEMKNILNTDYNFVAASQLMKRIGFVMTIPALYTMTIYNKKVNMSLANLSLVTKYKDGIWVPHLFINDLSVEEQSDHDRLIWRQRTVEELFKNLSQLITCLSAVSKVPRPILWENVAIYVYWLYETKINEETENQSNLESDFHYLIQDAPGHLFDESRNPLQMFYRPKKEDEEIRVRRTCCFYYALHVDGTCCSTCPKSKQELKKSPIF
ncbi:IucA/IucC family C-terminal-domain containing protein [Aquibacillus saliphilus]|uniref:IucA/IucC family C-terminal-domain containing protein n=1 Tax=Aquibacillus saliphilus TaxID=1909422 RepID=UPI001CF03C65|nr:IucA/IucC family C-terminal-domain containing protein [Aquibacillus saliphilus]